MIDMLLAVFGISLVAIILWHALPFLLLIGALALVAWIAGGVINTIGHHSHVAAAKRAALASRADRQHQKIMSGDVIGGTYGDYLPPKGLR